ncbi:MAG: hypothetical protein V4547_17180 [Bacteroidota bacterium]
MTPTEKANEYLSEFSKEKSIDMAETMRDYAKQFEIPEWVYFWGRVLQILNNQHEKTN